ncbi:MAG: transcriptional repressor [Propionibacteriaceae bacterium]|nr:transcriptional repressor [Propionibacteriaceae bacterium]
MTSIDPAAADTAARPRRRTHQRDLVTSVFDATDQWLTAQQVHSRLVGRGEPVGLATVYRTLAVLMETGGLDAIHSVNPPEWSYRRCSTQHHHHLTCRQCGKTVEIAAPPIENWAAYMASTHGFTAMQHTIEVSGLCPACQ